jgi:hypothetical protein
MSILVLDIFREHQIDASAEKLLVQAGNFQYTNSFFQNRIIILLYKLTTCEEA